MIPDSNEVRIEVTTHCNYNCVICPHDTMTRKKQTMSNELYGQILKELERHPYDTMTFSGIGEPLTDVWLPTKIFMANVKGYKTLLLTNGLNLDSYMGKLLRSVGLKSVRISCYGATPETYAKAHGKSNGCYQIVHDNIIEQIKILNFEELILTYNVIPGINDHEVNLWVNYWHDKVDRLEVWHPHNWVYGKKYRDVQNEKLPTCGRPFNGPLQIQADGTVIMCCFDYEGELLLGDLKGQTLEQIFSDYPAQMVRRNHDNNTHGDTICADCDQRNADKSDVMVYSSQHDLKERVTLTSTTYKRVTK